MSSASLFQLQTQKWPKNHVTNNFVTILFRTFIPSTNVIAITGLCLFVQVTIIEPMPLLKSLFSVAPYISYLLGTMALESLFEHMWFVIDYMYSPYTCREHPLI